jgi:hypothetical protein
MHRRLPLAFALILLAGCSAKLPRPIPQEDYATHDYRINVKDELGRPVEGARLQLTHTDLSTWLTHPKPVSRTEVEETSSSGEVSVKVAARLAQHWKGGWYTPENEPELAKQSYPHGGKDIWGFLTELRITGAVTQQVRTTFTPYGSDPLLVVPVPVVLKAPSNLNLPAQHAYQFLALDKEGTPVTGATIVAKVADHATSRGNRHRLETERKQHECFTDAAGLCSITLPVRMIVHYHSDYVGEPAQEAFKQLYSINGSGAYFGYLSSATAYGALGSFFRSPPAEAVRATVSGAELPPEAIRVRVPTPRDYYCSELKQPAQANFASKLDVWVRAIKLFGENRSVELEQICQQNFKGKNYIALSFQHRTKFNELKLNNYGIGVVIFDEVVRKLLEPIASAASNLPLDGYKLTIRTQKSNFIDKASPTEYLTYDFYLPRELVRQYKQSDISGQKLVNGSIVLLDGERIDIELK